MNTKPKNWESSYQIGKTPWDRGKSSNNLHYWLDNNLFKPCRIVVPGCGNGYEVLQLTKLGFDVVAIDIAPTPIQTLSKVLEESNLTAQLVLSDFLDWNPVDKFDVIFEQTSLCSLPPESWPQYEKQLYQWLKPQGKVLPAFMQTGPGGPPYHCAIEDMQSLFCSERWLWSKQLTINQKELGKTEVLHILQKR